MKKWTAAGLLMGASILACGGQVFADAMPAGRSVKSNKTVHESASLAPHAGPSIPKDVADAHWAREAVDKLIARGIIKLGNDARFNGKKQMTRYDMAVMLSRTLEEIDSGRSGKISPEDVKLVKKLVEELAGEVGILKKAHEEEKAAAHADVKALEDRLATVEKKYEDRLSKVEKAKSPVVFNGDWRFRYQHAQVSDNAGGKGSTSVNTNRIRLGGKIAVDDSMFGYFRFKADQQVRRNADIDGTVVSTDYFYIDKKKLLGGDWRVGRQYDIVGNGMIMIDFFDGIKHTRKLGDKFDFLGMAITQTTNPGIATRSHGLNANVAAVTYKPNDKHSVQLSAFRQNADRDKFGVTGLQTWEQWLSADLKGKMGARWSYFGTAAVYKNRLDEGNTVAAQRHLRGDIDNTGYLLGVTYDKPKKYSLGTHWAEQLDNFRAMDVLADVYYLGIPCSPLEDALNALSVGAANSRTGRSETILPTNAAAAAPAASPLGKAGDTRSGGGYFGDIHGYRDFQLKGKYSFRDDLDLHLIYNMFTPARSGYNYRDVKSVTARVRYAYNDKTNIELRGIHATSDYGRSVNDIRTEFYMKY